MAIHQVIESYNCRWLMARETTGGPGNGGCVFHGETSNHNSQHRMYPQRHGFCSLSLLQQVVEGGDDDVIAGKHEVSSEGLQFTASTVRVSPESSTTTSATTHKATTETTFIFSHQSANTRENTIKKANGVWRILRMSFGPIYRGWKW
ncbi:hypothetical protein QQP08_013148 [Theobroma cacao]|nr:hypothetical protein QQP08_013148 [Theobroma cacao]